MPAFVQGAHNHLSSGTSVTATFGAATTAGNTVVGIVSFGTGAGTPTVKDGGGTSYTQLDTFTDGVSGQAATTFYLPNCGASTTVVVTLSSTTGAISVSFAEYSGVLAASLDGHIGVLQATPGTGANGINSTAITTVASGDIVVGLVAGTGGQTSTFTGGTSPNAFTLRATTLDAGAPSFANVQIEDFVQSAAGSIAATFTQNAVGPTISFVVGLKASVVAGGIALGRVASAIFIPGARRGPTRGLRPTQAFPPTIPQPFIFNQDTPVRRSTAAAVLLLANLNTSFVPQPPAPPTLGWLQPFATPQQPARRQYDLNQGWVAQAPSAITPPASIETDVSQPGPVFTKTALYQAFATQPPTAPAGVVVTPPIGWLQPFAVPPQLLRRYDLNTTWVAQASLPAPTPSNLEWLQAFPTQTARRPVYDLNQGWVPQPPSVNISWLQPFAIPRAIARQYDLNQAWVPQPPPTTGTPTPSTLGWLQPFPTKTAPRPVYDLNQGWVPQVPVAPVVAPALGWLQSFATPPRDTLVFDTIIEPFALPAPAISASAEVDIAQPGPVYTRTFIYQSLFAPPQAVGGATPVTILPLESGSPQPGPVYQRTALYQAFATLPPQPAPIIVPSLLGWLSSFDQFYRQTYLYQSLIAPPPQPPAAVVPAPPFGWFTQTTMPPRETVVANTVLSPFTLPEIPIWGWYQPLAEPQRRLPRLLDTNSGWVPQPPVVVTPTLTTDLGWLQPFGIPRQPVRLWDWNTAWPAAPPAPFAITPSTLGWLQPFPIPPQPPRRPTFNEIYVPQNVGGTAPIPPSVLQPGGASVPHTFSRKRWRELQALIAAENAAVAKAERLTKESKREPLLKAARAAAAAIDAADKEGESKRLDALLLRNAESLRNAIRAATDVKRIREAANAIEISNAIVARAIEDEEDEMIQLLLLLS